MRKDIAAAGACSMAANGGPVQQFRQHVKHAAATAIVARAALTVLYLHRQVTGERKGITVRLLCLKEAH